MATSVEFKEANQLDIKSELAVVKVVQVKAAGKEEIQVKAV